MNAVVVKISLPELTKEDKRKAIAALTSQVAADSNPFIPFHDGTLRQSIQYPDGPEGGVIEYLTPYAHYVYEGEKYVNPRTGKSGYIGSDLLWHGWKGEKIPSGQPLKYHTAGTGDHWIERAAEVYMKEWEETVRRSLT